VTVQATSRLTVRTLQVIEKVEKLEKLSKKSLHRKVRGRTPMWLRCAAPLSPHNG
jgi:hypothetical protein